MSFKKIVRFGSTAARILLLSCAARRDITYVE